MKRQAVLFFIFCICCSFVPTRNYFMQQIRIGKYQYSIYKEKEYSHDDDMMMAYFVVYNEHKKQVCSGIISGVHHDTAYIQGSYSYTGKSFITKTYYHYPKGKGKFADSSISTYNQNDNGDLILKRHRDFLNGKVTENRY